MTTHLPAALLPLLLALVQGLLLWALWSLRRSFVPGPNICAAARTNSSGKPCGCAVSICWNRLWHRNGSS